MEKNNLAGLIKYVNQIGTRRNDDYTITGNYFCKNCKIQRRSDKRVIYTSLFQMQHKQMTKILIPLCKYSTDRYHLYILIIITIIYHIYIKCELYILAYTNN